MTKTVDQFSALASPASDDYILIWDTSAGATKKIAYSSFAVNLGTLIGGYTALVTPASDDLLAIYDSSAATMKKIAVSAFDYDLGAEIAAAASLPSPASDDLFAVYDSSTTTLKSIPYSSLIPGFLKADGTVGLTGDWDIGASRRIGTEKIRARSATGLRLEEDAGGLGIYIEDSTGNVGIGTATLTGAPRLTVNGAIRAAYDTATTSYFGRAAVGFDGENLDTATFAHVDQNTYLTRALAQTAAGYTIINAASGTYIEFDIGGQPRLICSNTALYPAIDDAFDFGSGSFRIDDVYATNGTIQTSDVRLKADVGPADLGLAFVRALTPLRYKLAGKRRPHYGLSAQDVRHVLDDLGVEDFAGYIHDSKSDAYGLRYTEFIAPLIAAVQELAARLEALEVTA